jgi:ABC-type antimicrobial peptide transport system permease subunit
VWTGLFSWLAIALTAMVVQMPLFERSTITERLLTSATVAPLALIPGAVGIFALWAKRKEPAGDGGRTVAVMIAGAIFVLCAVFYGGAGIIAGISVFAFFMAGLAGFYLYAALAIFRRWKYWRGAARSAALVAMVLLVMHGIGRVGENDFTRD